MNAGTPTNTFYLESAPFLEIVDGQQVTKVIRFEGQVIRKGNVISGTYFETVTDTMGVVNTIYAGSYLLGRPTRYAGAVTPTLSISTMGNDVLLNWVANDANCDFATYRSGSPYFVRLPAHILETEEDTASTDSAVLNSTVPNRFYRVRSFSCHPTIDFLEPNASIYQDSQEVGVFNFAIVPGN